MPISTSQINARRYDLDWLRVISFGLLILYHIGMFYVTWDFHVKSIHIGTTFEPIMKLLNPWRLSLLFLISGIAIRFAIDKHPSIAKFTLTRSLILFIPIVFGMLLIVAPQSWLQLLENKEINSGFIDFYLQYLSAHDGFSIIVPTWNHLWYVVYIFVYTLLLAPFTRPLSRAMQTYGTKLTRVIFDSRLGVFWLLCLPVLLFWVHHFVLKPDYPSTHALVDDWANHQLYFSIFVLGFLIAKDASFWQAVHRALLPATLLVIILSTTACIVWYLESQGTKTNTFIIVEFFSERFRKTAFAWFSIIALLSVAQRHLNTPSSTLSYLNQAVFSWYILHQTLIVMFGYWLTRQSLSFFNEFVVLTLSTYLACFLLHEYIIRRQKWLRPLFGMRLNAKTKTNV